MMQAALDMQSGIVLDPMAEFKALGQDPTPGDEAAIGVTGLTLSVKQGMGKAAYAPACTDTDAVGMACEHVTGLHLLFPAAQSANSAATLAAAHSSKPHVLQCSTDPWSYTVLRLM